MSDSFDKIIEYFRKKTSSDIDEMLNDAKKRRMQGFKLTCLNCGDETIITEDEEIYEIEDERLKFYMADNEIIDLDAEDGYIKLNCCCGNGVNEGEIEK